MDFLIFYEHVNREIENVTLVKKELEKRGYTCDIVSFNGPYLHKYHKKKNRARVVVTPWLRYDINVATYLPFAKKGYKIVNLQWEQVYNKVGVASGLVTVSGEAKKAYHMCWGENSRARLEEYGVAKENLAIVGAVQQDYGRPLLSDYYFSRDEIAEKFNLNNDKKWVLFVSSFSWANYPEDALKALYEKYGEFVYKNNKMHRTSQLATFAWIEELLQKSDNEFIYRPHPSEVKALAAELDVIREKYPHFHVISDLSVKQWAKVSDKVNLWISTSNAEIASLGVDYNIVRPCDIGEDAEVESMRGEEFVTDLDTFIKLNTDFSDESKERVKRRLEGLSHFYNYDPSRAAYERIADYLEEVYKSERVQKFKFPFKKNLDFKIKNLKKITVSRCVERQLANPEKNIVDKSHFKKVIKENMHKTIKKYKTMMETQNRMSEYIDNHG